MNVSVFKWSLMVSEIWELMVQGGQFTVDTDGKQSDVISQFGRWMDESDI